MHRLTRPMPATSPLTAVMLSVVLGLLTSSVANGFLGGGDAGWWLGALIASGFWFGMLWLLTGLFVPRVDVDTAAARLRVRGREYPFTALRSATRSLSTSPNASYLTYRFTLDDGRRFRLIAAGRPFRGPTPDGLAILRTMIEGSGIVEPDGLSPDQQRLRSDLQSNGRAVPVGRGAMLLDIDDLIGGEAPGAPSVAAAASTTSAAPLRDVEAELAEDAAALTLAQRHSGALLTLRRWAGRAAVGGMVLLFGLVVSFALQESLHWRGWSPGHPVAGVVAAAGAVLLLAGGAAWMLAADAAVRRVRRLADAHWDAADASSRARGVPTPYLLVDATGARRTMTTLAFLATLASVVMLCAAIAALYLSGDRGLIALVFVCAGGMITAAVYCWRASRRDAHATAERVALRSGTRLADPS